jgi:hypothetical protein
MNACLQAVTLQGLRFRPKTWVCDVNAGTFVLLLEANAIYARELGAMHLQFGTFTGHNPRVPTWNSALELQAQATSRTSNKDAYTTAAMGAGGFDERAPFQVNTSPV